VLPASVKARPWLLAVVSGLLLTFSFPPFGLWPLAWFALVPLLLAVVAAPDANAAANLGAVAGLIFYAASLHWLVKVFGPVAAAFWSLFGLLLALHSALAWKAARLWLDQGKAGAWIATVAATWIGIEYFRSEVWKINCSWLALGYSQISNTPLLQSCSLFGLYGLSGLIVAANAALSLLPSRRAPAARLAAAIVILAAWGGLRLRSPDAGRPARVALVQDEDYNLGKLDKLSLDGEAKNADLLVWPEYGFVAPDNNQEAFRRFLMKGLNGTKAVAVLSGGIFPEDMKHGWEQNFSWALSPNGGLLGRYDKHHPIPFIEARLPPNRTPAPIVTPLGVLGVQICYDLDFEDGPRRLQRLGAEILVVPDLDPHEWGAWQHRQHSSMSPARAVETGLWIARAASSGVSQIVDPFGRVREELAPLTSGALVGEVRLASQGTFYTRVGWLVPKLCLTLTAGLLLWFAAAFYETRKVKSRIS
jgi:apolipoprotein N-acyltransferase